MAMAAMEMVSAGGYWGWAFRKKYPQGVVGPVFKKTPVFGVRLTKLGHLTVSLDHLVHETLSITYKSMNGSATRSI
jgi:hypothetical protein